MVKPNKRIQSLEQQLAALLNQMEPFLLQASEVSHQINQLRAQDDEDEFFSRMTTYGILFRIVVSTCTPRLDLIYQLANRVAEMRHVEHDDVEAEPQRDVVLH
jgi:hypothetical protein